MKLITLATVNLLACLVLAASTLAFHASPSAIAKRASTIPASKSFLFQTAKPVETLSGWDPSNWTPGRIWNTPVFRFGSILGALAFAQNFRASSFLSTKAGATIHLLSFATYFGTVVYTTFVAGITMYKNLPRQTFGRLQSKLFPKYFGLCSISLLLQLITLPTLKLGANATRAVGLAFVMTLLNQFYLEPRSSKIMFDRYELEELPGGKESKEYKKLAGDFGKFHGMSSLTNLIGLFAIVVHGSYLAAGLVA